MSADQLPVPVAETKLTVCEAEPPRPSVTVSVPTPFPPLVNTIVWLAPARVLPAKSQLNVTVSPSGSDALLENV